MSTRECALQIREGNPRLFKVPALQRRVSKEAYDPCLFSFGPYHAGAASLSDGERIKGLVAAHLVGSKGLEELESKIQEHESRLSELYIQMRFEGQPDAAVSLAKLLALDSILIVSTSLNHHLGLYGAFLHYQILVDAIRLENQIPVFVLEYALESLFKGRALEGVAGELNMRTVLNDLTSFLHPFNGSRLAPISEAAVNGDMSLLGHVYNHLTGTQEVSGTFSNGKGSPCCSSFPYSVIHKLRKMRNMGSLSRLGTGPKTSSGRGEPPLTEKQAPWSWSSEERLLPTASHLARRGLRFSKLLEDSTFQAIKFHKDKLELQLPSITVGDETIPFLHNLLAYETTAIDAPHPVNSYVYFMDCLIDDGKDVQLLVDAGVICNLLGSDRELASSWNRLCSYVSSSLTQADVDTATEVRKLMEKRWRMWKASLTEKYCEKQPWLIISVIAATILLLLTFLQTIYAIKK